MKKRSYQTEKESKTMFAKKSLGQNFLKSEKALSLIVKSGEINTNDTILEIGPGRGALTEKLLKTNAQVIAIEKDRELIPVLSELFEKNIKQKKLFLYEKDILKTTPKEIKLPKKYKLIANIPYYITGEIIRSFLEKKEQPECMVLLVQKEVAERIVKKDGKESILSLSIESYGKATYIETVPRGAFAPSPKVDSAIIQIKNISRKNFKTSDNEENFFKTIKTGFKAKRKKAVSNLIPLYKREVLEKFFTENNLALDIRPEKIPFHIWLNLSRYL